MVSQDAMSLTCAYCSNEAELTREHIVPNFLYRANPRAKFGFNPKADRFITWEAQIKDVCLKCNGHHLSKLDSYAHQFCSENGIDRPNYRQKNNSIRLRFLVALQVPAEGHIQLFEVQGARH